jgi:D-alanyl-D-alanine carboxypeptidase
MINKGIRKYYSGIFILTILAFFLTLQACKKSEDSSSGTGNNSDVSKDFDNRLDSLHLKVKIPGVYLGIWAVDRGLTYEKTSGFRDVINSSGLTSGDLFRIGDVTKTFTTTVLLQLVDENKLTLDNKLNLYFPAIPNSENISVRQLLNMSSGLYDYTTDSVFWGQVKANPLRVWTPQELVNYSTNHTPYFPPGNGWHYSNTNTVIIGMIIEQITNSTLKQEIQNRIIIPMNLLNTFFPTDQYMPSGSICNGYIYSNTLGLYENITSKFNPSWMWASGNMISNPIDLKVWIKALVNGSLLSSTMQEERLKFIYSGTPSVKYGLGLYNLQDGFIGHKGTYPGYNNVVVYFPARGTLISIMFNLFPVDPGTSGYPSMDSFFKSVVNTLYPNMSPLEDVFIMN